MTRRFTIKVAGAEWVELHHGYVLRACMSDMGFVSPALNGRIFARANNGIDEGRYLDTLAAAKAYVIKQLATEEKSK